VSGLLYRLATQAMGAGGPEVHAAARIRVREPLDVMANDVVRTAPPPGLERPSGSRPDQRGPRRSESAKDDLGSSRGIEERQAAGHAPRRSASAEVSGSTMSAITDPASHRQTPSTDPGNEPRLRRPAQLEATAATRPDAVFDRPLPSNRNSEPNEVHVHIGLIEVTAVQAPAPPKRAVPTPARKSVSLEDYLAQRHWGAP
jgi:hypothetical protein